jgi:hypothetical protein
MHGLRREKRSIGQRKSSTPGSELISAWRLLFEEECPETSESLPYWGLRNSIYDCATKLRHCVRASSIAMSINKKNLPSSLEIASPMVLRGQMACDDLCVENDGTDESAMVPDRDED